MRSNQFTLTVYGFKRRARRGHRVKRVSTATDRRSCPNLDRNSPQSTRMGIRWSKFSPQGEEEPLSRLDPFIFREIMSGAASFLARDTRRVAVASFYVHISFSGEKRTWTSAYRTVSSYLKYPSITSGPSIDAATARRSPAGSVGTLKTWPGR